MKAILASTAVVVATLPALAEDAVIVVEEDTGEALLIDGAEGGDDLADLDGTRETNAGRT